MSHKDDGKNYFRQENFQESLTSYRAALLTAPETEKQILLSNIVACRLKIGGPAMAAAAVYYGKAVKKVAGQASEGGAPVFVPSMA